MPNVHVTAERWRDPQYAAAFYVFSRMRFSDKRRACFARVESAGIDKAGLLEDARAWSHGERVLVKIALDLFDPGCVAAAGHAPAGWGEAANVLDRENMDTALAALRLARQETRMVEVRTLEDGRIEARLESRGRFEV